MDPINGIAISNIMGIPLKSLDLGSDRKTLPGFLDYSLMIFYDSQRLGITIALSFLVLLSVVGNVATLVTNIRRQIRPFFRTCLVSLACSDLITTIFQSMTYYSQVSTEFASIWLLGEIMCGLIPFATTLAILVNSFILVGIAMDRFVAVAKIIKGAWEPSKIFCITFAVAAWGLAAGISSPMMTSYSIAEIFIIETDPANRSHQIDVTLAELCISDKITNQYYYTTIFFVIFLPMLIAFLWLNGVIAKEIWHRRHPISATKPQIQASGAAPRSRVDGGINDVFNPTLSDNEEQSTDKRTSETNTISNGLMTVAQVTAHYPSNFGVLPHTKHPSTSSQTVRTNREIRQIRMFKAIMTIMIVFFVCRLPTWIFLLFKLYNVANSNFHWMLQYTFGMLSIFNCVLNPLLYTYLTETIQCSSMFVENVKKMYVCCVKESHHQEPAQNTMAAGDVEGSNGYKEPADSGGARQFYCSEDSKTKMARLD